MHVDGVPLTTRERSEMHPRSLFDQKKYRDVCVCVSRRVGHLQLNPN